MKKMIFLFFMITGVYYAFANLDPLPTLPGSVEPMYEYREYEIIIPPPGTEPESTLHCLWPGTGCRFTATPQN